MHKGYILFDFSNVGFAATANKVLKAGDMETQGIYGFLRMIRPLIAVYPMLKPIVLGDGRSWRYDFFPDYKASRAKEATTKAELEMLRIRNSFKAQSPFIKEALKLLGVPFLISQNLEADDLAGMLVKMYTAKGHKIMLISGDKDWIQLIGPGVGWLDPRSDAKVKRVNKDTLKPQLGVDTPRQWLEVKAVMGDKSDELPGVGGIGDKGAVELLNTYGSVAAFSNGVLDKSIDVAKLPKKFRDFALNEDKLAIYRTNMDLMDLNSPKIPKPIDLRLEKGKLDHAAFQEFCDRFLFTSISKDVKGWCEPFERIEA